MLLNAIPAAGTGTGTGFVAGTVTSTSGCSDASRGYLPNYKNFCMLCLTASRHVRVTFCAPCRVRSTGVPSRGSGAHTFNAFILAAEHVQHDFVWRLADCVFISLSLSRAMFIIRAWTSNSCLLN